MVVEVSSRIKKHVKNVQANDLKTHAINRHFHFEEGSTTLRVLEFSDSIFLKRHIEGKNQKRPL